MIVIAHRHQNPASSHDKFLAMLPAIRAAARLAFRAAWAEPKEEFVAETIANAYCAYQRLVERGKQEVAHPTPLAWYAIKQVRAGRRVGGPWSVNDVCSMRARFLKGIVVERLDKYDTAEGEWREALVEDRRAGPAETAAARIDVAAWFRGLGRAKRRVAKKLARGETTNDVARMFGLSAGRVSQLRRELAESWAEFQGTAVA